MFIVHPPIFVSLLIYKSNPYHELYSLLYIYIKLYIIIYSQLVKIENSELYNNIIVPQGQHYIFRYTILRW